MKIHILSDLHVDHHGDVKDLRPVTSDLLVIAGDLSVHARLNEDLDRVLQRVAPRNVLFVWGNHDYWGAPLWDLMSGMRRHRWDLEGVRFVGATHWTPAYKEPKFMRDFTYFQAGSLYRAHELDDAWIRKHSYADVAVTHFMPDLRCVDPRYVGDMANEYYAHEEITFFPKLWIYGHTHTAQDQKIDGVRCVCNPRGYPGERTGWDPEFVVEV